MKDEYKITKEQILTIASYGEDKSTRGLKNLFPKAFEKEKIKLEVGKWYIRKNNEKCILFYTGASHSYGSGSLGDWSNSWWLNGSNKDDFREATKQEVLEALKKEAIRRGFKEGVAFENACGGSINVLKGSDFRIGFAERNNLHEKESEGIIFEDGIWAEIIQTITKEEAEKELGKKIV